MDQELFQIEAYQLFTAEEIWLFLGHVLEIGVVQAAGKTTPGLHDNVGQKIPLCAVCLEQTFPEEFHSFAMAVERDDHQVGGDPFYCFYIVEFAGLMEEDLAFLENGEGVSGGDAHLSLVHEDKFPEVMAFFREGEVAHIFKVMNAVDPFNGNGIFQIHTVICHKPASPGPCFLFCKSAVSLFFFHYIRGRRKKQKKSVDCTN